MARDRVGHAWGVPKSAFDVPRAFAPAARAPARSRRGYEIPELGAGRPDGRNRTGTPCARRRSRPPPRRGARGREAAHLKRRADAAAACAAAAAAEATAAGRRRGPGGCRDPERKRRFMAERGAYLSRVKPPSASASSPRTRRGPTRWSSPPPRAPRDPGEGKRVAFSAVGKAAAVPSSAVPSEEEQREREALRTELARG